MTTTINIIRAIARKSVPAHRIHPITRRIAMLLAFVFTLMSGAVAQTAVNPPADGVYVIENKYNSRGTMCYGTFGEDATEYLGLSNITLGSYGMNNLTVNDDEDKYWYVSTTDQGTYIYSIGQAVFLQAYAGVAVTCAGTVAGGFTFEEMVLNGVTYTLVKSGDKYLSYSCGYSVKEGDGQLRWLGFEDVATALTFTAVPDGMETYSEQITAANEAITQFENVILGVAPQVSGDTETHVYRIVNTRRHTDNNENRYLYPLAETGTYGRWLKITTVGDVTDASEQYWYLVDAGDGYRYIVNRNTGEYLYHNTTAVNGQKRFELSATQRTRFKITPSWYTSSNDIQYKSYNILPETNESSSFNPHGGADGYIASYDKTDGGSHWFFADEATVTRCATPEITIEGKSVRMGNGADGSIHYTDDGTLPTASSATCPADGFSHDTYEDGDIILARAFKDGAWGSAVAAKVLEASPAPVIAYNSDFTRVVISNGLAGTTAFYYTTDGTEPTYDITPTIGKVSIEGLPEGETVKAFALTEGMLKSEVVSLVARTVTEISTADELRGMTADGIYRLTADIALTDGTSIVGFKGVFDGGYHTISGLTAPLFAATDGATIRNVVIDGANITGGTGNVGAIVGTAQGATRIYNCGVLSGSIGGGDNVGGIAGQIEGTSRVINCYSFAGITGGTTVGGIVGHNAVASTAGNLATIVMNCMFYGNITGGTEVYPIYGGEKISNVGADGDANGINNYNYYRHEASIAPTAYNCALAAEERYLTRFEFYRHVLNSQRRLCAFYVTGDVTDTAQIGKWVLDNPESIKYPIVKPWGKYTSAINREPVSRLGTLTVNVAGVNATGAGISATLSLPITDMNPETHDYNYYKVQLPYYNDHFVDNYTNNKVVTGWKITAVTGGTAGELTTTGDNRYNYADRNCTAKDINRVLAQGGFFNVPQGVTAITIEPYWGKAVYLADRYYDVLYNTGYTGYGFAPNGLGQTPDSYKGQTVYKTLGSVWAQLQDASTVYDNAIVLVGNYHSHEEGWSNGSKPFTVMSVDDNRDNEPDYGLYFATNERPYINPVRFDFINHVGLGMAAKVDGYNFMRSISVLRPKGWFEVTETALAIYDEFEYDWHDGTKAVAPLILNGGIYNRFCSGIDYSNNGLTMNRTSYIIVGGNSYFKAYTPGCHSGETFATAFPPVSVLGGEFEEFYLSGQQPNTEPIEGYNALCYGNGGKIGIFAGAYQEAIDGDVIIKFDHMIVNEFYGGGVNDKKPIKGNIAVTIDNSRVGFYCGGPKFGDMSEGKTITTNATGTDFEAFYGGGYGGTSLYSLKDIDAQGNAVYPRNWYEDYFKASRGQYYKEGTDDRGIKVSYVMDHFSYAGGKNVNARFFSEYASLSVAEVGNITSTLIGCTVNGDLYGAGCQGKVTGNVVTILDDCTINGSAYAGGYSASVPTCEVMPAESPEFSLYDTNTGIFTPAKYPAPVEYKWTKADAALESGNVYIDDDKKEIYTYVIDLTDLGTVEGNTAIEVKGNSAISGSVFGGGNESKVRGNTHVHIKGGEVKGSVYGAGNQAEVTGTTDVVIGGGE